MPTQVISEDMANEIFTRLRETEAQTREQKVSIDNLTEQLKNASATTKLFIDHLDQREQRSERREKNLMTIIYVLIGAVVSLAVGPKIAKDMFSQAVKMPVAHYLHPIAPMPNHDNPFMTKGINI